MPKFDSFLHSGTRHRLMRGRSPAGILEKRNRGVCVAYSANPRDAGEAKFNSLTAQQVSYALKRIGFSAVTLGLSDLDSCELPGRCIFNLCDDDNEGRSGIVQFAQEIDALVKTGSGWRVLSAAQEKTLSWLEGVLVPRYWTGSVPRDVRYIAKPLRGHGSLLISEKNICGDPVLFGDGFFFQEFLDGPEFSACFVGREFLGLCMLRERGIVTRDDKWDESLELHSPIREWFDGKDDFLEVRRAAESAWAELLEGRQGEGDLPYGRVDLRLDSLGNVYVIDLNPNAYLGKDGLLFSCWKNAGGGYEDLIATIAAPLSFGTDQSSVRRE